jgi:hypothetical protein
VKASLAERWIAAANAATELSTPSEIVANIRTADAPDDGIRAASYEARISNGHRTDSHPERMALDERQAPAIRDSWKRDDEIKVSRHGLSFIDAISAINAGRDRGTADTWDEAVHDASLLADLHGGTFISAAIDTSSDLAPFHATIRAVEHLTTLAHRWGCPHVATIQERLRHPDVCLSHARIDIERPICGALVVCKMCRDLLAEWADPPKVHRDPEAWPPNELLAAKELGSTIEYRRLRAEWLTAHGIPSATKRFRVG